MGAPAAVVSTGYARRREGLGRGTDRRLATEGFLVFTTKRVMILFSVAGVAAIVAAAVFAFTASNTVPESKAGEGAGAITGYVVDSIHYTLNAADPSKVDSVSFNLDSAPVAGGVIRVRLNPGGGSWYNCTNVGVAVTCVTTAPQATTSTSTQLSVVVAQ